MTRLLATMKLDFTIQQRNNLYTISIGLAILLTLIARFAFDRAMLTATLPAMFVLGIGGTTYMFLAGMIIFEKNERTLNSLIVTPLTTWEYIASKGVTLTALALLEATIITAFSYGLRINLFALYGGLLLLALLNLLISLGVVVRYDSVTDFLVPSFVIVILIELPLLMQIDLGPIVNAIWYAIPTTAPYLLLQAAYAPIAGWQIAYGILYSFLWLVPLAWWAYRAFQHHIIEQAGS